MSAMQVLHDFDGRTALVTGASSGIGEAVAWELARAGATVCLVGASERVDRLTHRITDEGLKATGFRVDVADYEGLELAYRSAATMATGRIDVAVHAAGVMYSGSTATSNPNEMKRTIDTNLLGLMYSSQLALRHMESGGQIVNVSSLSGRTPSKSPAYTASKFGVTGFTEVLRNEAGVLGIRVTCVEPGLVESRFQRHVGAANEAFDDRPSLVPEDIAEAILAVLRLPENVNVGEIVVRHVRQ